MLISVVIRTLNQSKCLGELLTAIESQVPQLYDREVVVVDSGSDDGTIAIAWDFGCRIVRKLACCTCERIPAYIIITNL